MVIWQVDFYRRPLQTPTGEPQWELVVCDHRGELQYTAFCPQTEANARWLGGQLHQLLAQTTPPPEQIQVFRPQCLNLIETACSPLQIPVLPHRRTLALKAYLKRRSQTYASMLGYTGQAYNPLEIEQPPPQPLPENLWGDQWQFVALPAQTLEQELLQRPIPVREVPPDLLPSHLNLSGSTLIPGLVIYGDRQSMKLARWMQQQQPATLQAVPGEMSGVVLSAGLCDRWVLVTYNDADVAAAAQTFEQRKPASQGLHFLLVQPDDSGFTFTGIWLLN